MTRDRQVYDSMTKDGYLEDQFLLAMPSMGDTRFERTVIYMCSHSEDGAMGLVVNKPMDWITFSELLDQLSIEVDGRVPDLPIHAGGPVETGRGFVLHTSDFVQDSTLEIGATRALTATVDILKAIAMGTGPRHSLLALGYASWAPGQLESEIQQNAWLTLQADDTLLFETRLDMKYTAAMKRLGIDLSMLSADAGHA